MAYSYHLTAVVITSQRTEAQYEEFLLAHYNMMRIITDSDIHFETTMADAEQGQLNAIQRVHPDSNKLMCFFHILYNARKRMRSLTPESIHDVYCYDMILSLLKYQLG
jgi:hypothetical protein